MDTNMTRPNYMEKIKEAMSEMENAGMDIAAPWLRQPSIHTNQIADMDTIRKQFDYIATATGMKEPEMEVLRSPQYIATKDVKFELPIPPALMERSWISENLAITQGNEFESTYVVMLDNHRTHLNGYIPGEEPEDRFWNAQERTCSLWHAYTVHLPAARANLRNCDEFVKRSTNPDLRQCALELLPQWRWFVWRLEQDLKPHFGSVKEREELGVPVYSISERN